MGGVTTDKQLLANEDVRLIRELLDERERLRQAAAELSYARIGEKFDVPGEVVRRIADGSQYAGVK